MARAKSQGRAPGWMERLGAALATPTHALAASETAAGSGRAPADLAVLILAGFMASNLPRMVKAAWLAADGSGIDGIHLLLADLSGVLMGPLVFVVVGGVALTLLAGHHRAMAADFDLACVAAVPLAAVPMLLHLLARLGLWTQGLLVATTWLGYGWGAGLLVLAVRQARLRGPREAAP